VTLIPVSLAVEGLLDEIVLRRLLELSGKRFAVGACYGRRGKDHLRENIGRFNHAAAHNPFVVLTDLDDEHCAPGVVGHWLPNGRHHNLVLRIAVREVESWLLADGERFANFLGVRRERIPQWPDLTADPKDLVVELARTSRKREIREDLVPIAGSTGKVGRNYGGQLMRFAATTWLVDEMARRRSPSLGKALRAVQCFSPQIVGSD